MGIEQDLAAVFERAGAKGFVHAVAIDGAADGGREVSLDADEIVVAASVFKIPVMLEFARQASAGKFALTDRIRVPADRRTTGPTGLSVMSDEIELSWRDLAFFMMSVSDNTATDVIMERIGVDAIAATLTELGFTRTVVAEDCESLLAGFVADIGAAGYDIETLDDIPDDVYDKIRALDPASTNRTTPREMTRLLSSVWRDEAGPAGACAEVRRIMGLQVWPHRLSSGFGDGVKISAKTGTLPAVRNECGVVELPAGHQYAVAVFTKANSYVWQQPAIDAAIGTAARLAVDELDRRVTDGGAPPGR